jgi:putative endonuclease
VSKQRIATGKSGEDAAVSFLERNGYTIIQRNFRTSLGEIDIVAQEKDVLCFIEVKTRSDDSFGAPQEALTKTKQRQIAKAALTYLKAKRLFDRRARFDVVWVRMSREPPAIGVIKNAFELSGNFTY